jgi:hypothetical protein
MTVKPQFDEKATVAVSSSGKTDAVVSQRNEELMKELHTNSLNMKLASANQTSSYSAG